MNNSRKIVYISRFIDIISEGNLHAKGGKTISEIDHITAIASSMAEQLSLLANPLISRYADAESLLMSLSSSRRSAHGPDRNRIGVSVGIEYVYSMVHKALQVAENPHIVTISCS